MFPQHPISAVTDGLTTAFSLANMLHSQRTQDAQLALAKQRMADEKEMEQSREERQNADLAMRLNAMGARQATPSDDLEAQTGMATRFHSVQSQVPQQEDNGNSVQGWAGGGLAQLPQSQTRIVPSFEPSDIKSRLVKAGGQKWVMPSESDQNAREDRANKRDQDAAVSKAAATEKARGDAKISVDQSRLEKFGLAITDENATLLGLKPGSKIQEEHVDDYNRALATAWARQAQNENGVVHAVPMYGERGTGVAVVRKDGTVSWNPIDIGDKFTKPTTTSANEQRLADKAATDELVNEAASRYARNYPSFEEAEAALKADAAKDPFVGKQYLRIRKALPGSATADKPKTLNNMTPEEAMNALQGAQGKPAPKKDAKTAAPAKRQRYYNKKTKETIEWDGKAWVKAGA